MKSFICILFATCVLAILSTSATASVYESNNTPGYVKKVVMSSTSDCGGCYYTSFTCEHYLNYGESMGYEDYATSSGDCTCYYVYSVHSITWIPVGPYVAVNAAVKPRSHLGLSFGLNLGYYTQTNRAGIESILSTDLGWPNIGLNQGVRDFLNKGCIGIPYVYMVRRVPGQDPIWPETAGKTWPEWATEVTSDHGPLEGYATYEAAMAHSCTDPEYRTVIFCKRGRWAGGVPPEPDNSGRIPLNSVVYWEHPDTQKRHFEYWTLVGDKWITLSHGIEDDQAPQDGGVYTVPPGPLPAPMDGIIFFKRCVRKNQQ